MTTETNNPKAANAPRYHAYSVTEGTRGQKDYWFRIGAVFPHEDGEGETLVIHGLPLHFDGRIVMRAPKAETEVN